MSMLKFILDMNLSPEWVPYLGAHSMDARHWSQIGKATARDIEIFEYAVANSCTIITNDLDFGTLLAKTKSSKPSVIQLRVPNLRPENIGTQVIALIQKHREILERGAIITLCPDKIKASLLPIGRK